MQRWGRSTDATGPPRRSPGRRRLQARKQPLLDAWLSPNPYDSTAPRRLIACILTRQSEGESRISEPSSPDVAGLVHDPEKGHAVGKDCGTATVARYVDSSP